MKSTLIRGVPLSMQQDGWWLSPPPSDTGPKPRNSASPAAQQAAALVALIALGDMLMWDVVPGLSLAVFGGAILVLAAALWPDAIQPRRLAMAAGVTVLALLPLVELVQPLSMLFFLAGLPIALSLLAGRRPIGALRYWWRGPVFSVLACLRFVQSPTPKVDLLSPVRRAALHWGLPVGVGLIFVALLIQANPVLERWALSFPAISITGPDPARLIFWAGLAVLIWPALCLVSFAKILSPDAKPVRQGPYRLPRLVNKDAILRSLVVFNALFAVQNGLDLAVLLGGAHLPDGMTYAEYAHRGAYPLVMLALLSGAFALLARPFITGAPLMKTLLLVWVAQTVWLTVSSVARLEMYVDVYGLTRLRIAAAIWMGLVGSGLGLILVQVVRGLPNMWIVMRVSGLGVAALYLCCFLSFDQMIARYNLTRPVIEDRAYLCNLSESVVPEILKHTGKTVGGYCGSEYWLPQVSTPSDWREWGFRNARVRRSLAALKTQQDTQ